MQEFDKLLENQIGFNLY